MHQAEEFRQAYSLSNNHSGTKGIQKSLIDEEWSEFHEAFHFKNEHEQLKELCDLVYVCYQFAANEGWNLDEAMDRVHKSNMSKLFYLANLLDEEQLLSPRQKSALFSNRIKK